jgi:hypothetical protein
MLNVALWIVQALLAGVFTLTGSVKLVLPREVLERRMHWAAAWPRGRIKLLGLAEVAGALGLVVPAATSVGPVLTPIAALCLAVLMVGAVGTHRRLGESVVPAVVIGALCLVVGAARLQLSSPVSPRPELSQRVPALIVGGGAGLTASMRLVLPEPKLCAIAADGVIDMAEQRHVVEGANA